MKPLILILISLFALSSFAGNGGGTMGAAKEYVKFLGTDRADLVFEHGITNTKNELYTTIYKNRAEEFNSQSQSVLNAIEISKQTGDWAEIK